MYGTVGEIDTILCKLLQVQEAGKGRTNPLSGDEIGRLCKKSKAIFLREPMLLELNPPLKICGDIHGQYPDLMKLFAECGFPPTSNYLFLGDYVDRGKQSVDTMSLLLAYKVKYPLHFFLLRGNHECAEINRAYGFLKECQRNYSKKLWEVFNECFNCMPVAAVVGSKIFCCHGGLSPELDSLDQINNIARPTKVPTEGLLCDLLWSDPDNNIHGWADNRGRDISFTFGSNVVSKFLKKHNLDLICRAHQDVNGYEFMNNKRELVTIFSAVNYCGTNNNDGGIMSVDERLLCTFHILPSAW